MRIAINTLAINRRDFGGGEKYLYHLIKNLSEIDKKNPYFIFTTPQNEQMFFVNQKNFQTIICPSRLKNRIQRIIFEQFALPRLAKKYKIDVFHGPNNVIPFRLPCSSVVTAQFMINFLFPKCYKPIYKRWYFNFLMRFAFRKSDKIIAISNNLKNEIIQNLNVPNEKIVVAHLGVDKSFSQVKDKNLLSECQKNFGITKPYILSVANNVPNKNFTGLIQAFDYLKGKYQIPHQLVFAGSLDILKSEKERTFAALKETKNLAPGSVIFTGYIEHKDLPALYSGADVFVLPSFCESFGIPLIEAMKCCVPIVTSNVSVMPEIVSNAAITVNPYNSIEVAEAIYSVIKNPILKRALVNKAAERVKFFSWKQMAQKTIMVYEGVYKKNQSIE